MTEYRVHCMGTTRKSAAASPFVVMSSSCGEHRIARLAKANKGDVYSSKYLPDETRQYIPNFIAAYNVGRAAGLHNHSHDTVAVKEVTVSGKGAKTVKARELAKRHGVTAKRLRALNPALLTDEVPAGYRIVVPDFTNKPSDSGGAYSSKPGTN